MSFTNQTQHYGLPQYVGTDVPAWLTDINTAFATIDQGMNAAKTQADSAATAAGQAANDVSALQSTVNTQATQISAAAQAASAAQTTANTADGKADVNAGAISGLDSRVTALEQGGGADSGVIYKIVTITPSNNIIPEEIGYYIASAVLASGVGPTGVGLEIARNVNNAAKCFVREQNGASYSAYTSLNVLVTYVDETKVTT